MRIFLTGATGHLGRHVATALRRGGHEVVALTRQRDLSLPFAVRQVPGDLLDAGSVARAQRGCEVSVHCGAVYSDDASRGDEMERVARLGTQHVLEGARRHGHRHVVLASSMVTVGFAGPDRAPRDEGSWNRDPVHPYFRAKVAAERQAVGEAERLGLPLTVLCPGGLLGPLDFRTTPTMAFLADLVNGTAQTVRGGVNYVDVRDVADAFAVAASRGTPGRFLLTGECLPMQQLGGLLRVLTGRRPVHLPLPRGVVLGASRWLEPARHAMACESVDRWPAFRADRARAAFDFHPRPVEDALADALRWLARTGAIEPGRVASWEGRLDIHGDTTLPPGPPCFPSTMPHSTPSASKVTPMPMPLSRRRTRPVQPRSVG